MTTADPQLDEKVTLPAHVLYRLVLEAYSAHGDEDCINDVRWYLAKQTTYGPTGCAQTTPEPAAAAGPAHDHHHP
jgi:hypothetical protein